MVELIDSVIDEIDVETELSIQKLEEILESFNTLTLHEQGTILLSGTLQRCLHDVQPKPVILSSNNKLKIVQGWYCKNLLSAMYTMFFLDVTKGIDVRTCANETCLKPFVPSDPRKIYCSPECLTTQRQRNYRKRKKDKDKSHIDNKGVNQNG